MPQSVVASKTWPLAPVQWADRTLPVDEAHARQLVEADMLYVRDLARLDALDAEQLRHLALVCDVVYAQRGVALLALRELVRRADLPADTESAYRAG